MHRLLVGGILQAAVRVDCHNPNTQYAITPGYVVPEAMVDAERTRALRHSTNFGNGDGMFSAVEQRAAFGAAVGALAATPLSQSRRIQVGLQIDF